MQVNVTPTAEDYRRTSYLVCNLASRSSYAWRRYKFSVVTIGVLFAWIFYGEFSIKQQAMTHHGWLLASYISLAAGLIMSVFAGHLHTQELQELHYKKFAGVPMIYRLETDGLLIQSPAYTLKYNYEGIEKVAWSADYLLIFISEAAAQFIPKRCFDDEQAAQAFFERLSTYVEQDSAVS